MVGISCPISCHQLRTRVFFHGLRLYMLPKTTFLMWIVGWALLLDGPKYLLKFTSRLIAPFCILFLVYITALFNSLAFYTSKHPLYGVPAYPNLTAFMNPTCHPSCNSCHSWTQLAALSVLVHVLLNLEQSFCTIPINPSCRVLLRKHHLYGSFSIPIFLS